MKGSLRPEGLDQRPTKQNDSKNASLRRTYQLDWLLGIENLTFHFPFSIVVLAIDALALQQNPPEPERPLIPVKKASVLGIRGCKNREAWKGM